MIQMLPKTFLYALLASVCALQAGMKPAGIFREVMDHGSPGQQYALLFAMPKGGDIHHHFGGGIPMDTLIDAYRNPRSPSAVPFFLRTRIEYCDADCLPVRVLFHVIREADYRALGACCQDDFAPVASLTEDQVEAWRSELVLDRSGEGRDEFFEKTWWRIGPITSDITLAPDLLVENMRQFGQEGIRYLELQMSPFRFTDPAGNSIPPETVYQVFKERLADPDAKATGVTVRFQDIILRFHPQAEDHVRRAYAFIHDHRDLWVGINMAGREDNGKGQAARFIEVYREMQRIYPKIPLSIHAGEADEENDNIRDTLLLGVDRIGHGVNLLKDPDTYLLMRQGKYLIEINLISNRLLEYVPDLSKHPFPIWLRTGIPVCLNTDDRAQWDSNFTDEYMTAATQFNLSWSELVQVGRNSLEYAFCDPDTREQLLADYDDEISKFEQEFLQPGWADRLARVEPVVSNYGQKAFLD